MVDNSGWWVAPASSGNGTGGCGHTLAGWVVVGHDDEENPDI
jgi:hypothetical protein